MEYFDPRGVRRTDGVSLDDGVLCFWREHPGLPTGAATRSWQPVELAKVRDAVSVAARPRLAAMSLHLFAGLRVRDFEAARGWYERLLGEPTFFPHAAEAVWTLAEDRSVYVAEHADGAGNSVVTIFLDDLDAHVAAIAARGLEPDERETYSNGVRKALYRDPDGNELGFGGAPLDTGP